MWPVTSCAAAVATALCSRRTVRATVVSIFCECCVARFVDIIEDKLNLENLCGEHNLRSALLIARQLTNYTPQNMNKKLDLLAKWETLDSVKALWEKQ